MRKPKVQPLIPFILRRLKIRLLLVLIHTLPHTLSLLIGRHIIHLRTNKHYKIPSAYRNQHFIAPAVQRLIIIPINVLADDTTRLHAHIVQRRRNGTRAHCPGVARRDGDEDGVNVRVADEQCGQDPARPWGGVG